jgi:hypothetical protein
MKTFVILFVFLSCTNTYKNTTTNTTENAILNKSVDKFDEYLNLKYPSYKNTEDKMLAFLNEYERIYNSENNLPVIKEVKKDYFFFNELFSEWEKSGLINDGLKNIKPDVKKWLIEMNKHYNGKPFIIDDFNNLNYNIEFYYNVYNQGDSPLFVKNWIREIVVLQMSPSTALNALRNPNLRNQLNQDYIKILFLSEFVIPILMKN